MTAKKIGLGEKKSTRSNQAAQDQAEKMADEVVLMRANYMIDKKLHTKFKIAALNRNESMTEVLLKSIRGYVKRNPEEEDK